jgi:TrmH family RNA methyltransferase
LSGCPSTVVSDAFDRCVARGVPALTVTERALDTLADARTPQGIVGVATRPVASLSALERASLLVVLDRIADPGNLGTVIRTADAAGADGVVLTAGSVDPTNAKAVRASAGSFFHLPVIDGVGPAQIAGFCRTAGMRLIAAVPDATQRYDQLSYDTPAAIVFGNEAHGVSDVMRTHARETVSVPMHRATRNGYRGHAESLNLATSAAVVLFEIARQRDHRGAAGADDRRRGQRTA